MNEKDSVFRCWCCEHFLVRFDNNIMPNKITGGICVKNREECKPYNEKCNSFSLNMDFLPDVKDSPHSFDAYVRRHPEVLFEKNCETKK